MRRDSKGLFLFATVLAACASPEPRSARDVSMTGKRVTEAELQQDVERFTSSFMESVAEAAEQLGFESDPGVRELAMRQVVLYSSSSLEIASGMTPEISLLDMIVFVSLSRSVLERHWIPVVFGERGRRLETAFEEGERELWNTSDKLLRAEQKATLRGLIDGWIRDHPKQIRVEMVRFNDFSFIAGRLSERRAREASGLFGDVRSATQAADQAVLLGERGLFLANRLPSLLRLQARFGASQLITDSLRRFEEAPDVQSAVPELSSVLKELSGLIRDTKLMSADAQTTLHSATEVLDRMPPQGDIQKTISSASELTRRAESLLDRVQKLLPADAGKETTGAASVLLSRVDHYAVRWTVYLVVIGAAWSLSFWGGFAAFKRLTAQKSRGSL